jgi:hypothetical protein
MLTAAAVAVSGCGSLGDTGAIRDANELAVACRHDEALALLDRAQQGGGLSAYIAELEQVVFLRDAGRYSEASALLAERNTRAQASDDDVAEAEAAIEKSLAELRKEREKKSGRATCPGNESA